MCVCGFLKTFFIVYSRDGAWEAPSFMYFSKSMSNLRSSAATVIEGLQKVYTVCRCKGYKGSMIEGVQGDNTAVLPAPVPGWL